METDDLMVTLVQSDIVWESPTDNLQRLTERLREITDTNVIVLPEMFTTGFTMNPVAVAESMRDRTVSWMLEMARSKKADIVGSSVIVDGGRYYNRLLWAKPDGRLLHYDKRHLFGFAGEHERYAPGTSVLIVPVRSWRIAAFICYDLRFPVWSRNVAGKYDAALYIANWPESRAAIWRTLLKARAIENQCYVMGVNRVGSDGKGLSYCGDSMLIDPLGEVCLHEHGAEAVVSGVMSMRTIDATRQKFPFLKDADRFHLDTQERNGP